MCRCLFTGTNTITHPLRSMYTPVSCFGNEASCEYVCCLQHATLHKSMKLAHCGFYSYVLSFVLITSLHMFSTIQCADNVCTERIARRTISNDGLLFSFRSIYICFIDFFSMIRFRLTHFLYQKKNKTIEVKPKFLLVCASHKFNNIEIKTKTHLRIALCILENYHEFMTNNNKTAEQNERKRKRDTGKKRRRLFTQVCDDV